MKKNKIFKALTFIATVIMLLAVFALPIGAETTAAGSSPQIQINPDFDPNSMIRTIINIIVGFIAIIFILIGGYNFLDGLSNADTKQKNSGLILCLAAFAIGALILFVANSVLA